MTRPVQTIGVVGAGTVGKATARCFLEHANVRVYDVLPERQTHTLEEVLGSDLVFVCLPTPAAPGGMDLSAVRGFFASLIGSDACFVLKSTVPVGATRRLRGLRDLPNLVHSPEFLTARCAMVDAQTPARLVVGGVVCECAARLVALYEQRFPGVPIFRLSSDGSEAVKLITNAFFATKVAFFNEARTLTDRLGLDWEAVRAAVLADGRIAHAHTQVPGPDGRFGFGGGCLPKDLAALVAQMEELRLEPDVTGAALRRNDRDRRGV